MSIILNLETSTPVCSVAISKGDEILSIRETHESNSHSSKLSIFIQECMEEIGINKEELSAVAVSSGPGSYTGLRIGYSTAKGLCYALDIPIIAVDTLLSMAMAVEKEQTLNEQKWVCPMIDARRMEVYMALFSHNFEKKMPHQAFILEKNSFGKFFDNGIDIVFCGNGSFKVSTVIASSKTIISEVQCSAKHMASLSAKALAEGSHESLAYTSPLYIKSPFITQPKKRL